MRRRHLIGGRVQGVGFRYFARSAARRLGVAGWVRNLPDGQVEAEGQGSGESLQAFASELRRGPPGSLVTELLITEIPDEAEGGTAFAIR